MLLIFSSTPMKGNRGALGQLMMMIPIFLLIVAKSFRKYPFFVEDSFFFYTSPHGPLQPWLPISPLSLGGCLSPYCLIYPRQSHYQQDHVSWCYGLPHR